MLTKAAPLVQERMQQLVSGRRRGCSGSSSPLTTSSWSRRRGGDAQGRRRRRAPGRHHTALESFDDVGQTASIEAALREALIDGLRAQAPARVRPAARGRVRSADQPAAVRVDGDPGKDSTIARLRRLADRDEGRAVRRRRAVAGTRGARRRRRGRGCRPRGAERRAQPRAGEAHGAAGRCEPPAERGPTLRSHGFLTRTASRRSSSGRLGRLEVEQYPESTVVQAVVEHVVARRRTVGRQRLVAGDHSVRATADAVVVATGLRESYPALPMLRAFYGTSVHSCVECDATRRPRAVGLPLRDSGRGRPALVIAAWTDDLVVYTNGAPVLDDAVRDRLASVGVPSDERPVADLEGTRTGMTGVRLMDGHVGGHGRGPSCAPQWHVDLDWLDAPCSATSRGSSSWTGRGGGRVSPVAVRGRRT